MCLLLRGINIPPPPIHVLSSPSQRPHSPGSPRPCPDIRLYLSGPTSSPSIRCPYCCPLWSRRKAFLCVFFFFFFFFFFWLLGPHLQHMEVPRLGVESELQLLAYTTATATRGLGHVCNLHRSSWQRQIFHPLGEARDRGYSLGS